MVKKKEKKRKKDLPKELDAFSKGLSKRLRERHAPERIKLLPEPMRKRRKKRKKSRAQQVVLAHSPGKMKIPSSLRITHKHKGRKSLPKGFAASPGLIKIPSFLKITHKHKKVHRRRRKSHLASEFNQMKVPWYMKIRHKHKGRRHFSHKFAHRIEEIDVPSYLLIRHRHRRENFPEKVCLPLWFFFLLCLLVIVGIIAAHFIGYQKGYDAGLAARGAPLVERQQIAPSFEACLPYSNATVTNGIRIALDRCKAFTNGTSPILPDYVTVYDDLILAFTDASVFVPQP